MADWMISVGVDPKQALSGLDRIYRQLADYQKQAAALGNKSQVVAPRELRSSVRMPNFSDEATAAAKTKTAIDKQNVARRAGLEQHAKRVALLEQEVRLSALLAGASKREIRSATNSVRTMGTSSAAKGLGMSVKDFGASDLGKQFSGMMGQLSGQFKTALAGLNLGQQRDWFNKQLASVGITSQAQVKRTTGGNNFKFDSSSYDDLGDSKKARRLKGAPRVRQTSEERLASAEKDLIDALGKKTKALNAQTRVLKDKYNAFKKGEEELIAALQRKKKALNKQSGIIEKSKTGADTGATSTKKGKGQSGASTVVTGDDPLKDGKRQKAKDAADSVRTNNKSSKRNWDREAAQADVDRAAGQHELLKFKLSSEGLELLQEEIILRAKIVRNLQAIGTLQDQAILAAASKIGTADASIAKDNLAAFKDQAVFDDKDALDARREQRRIRKQLSDATHPEFLERQAAMKSVAPEANRRYSQFMDQGVIPPALGSRTTESERLIAESMRQRAQDELRAGGLTKEEERARRNLIRHIDARAAVAEAGAKADQKNLRGVYAKQEAIGSAEGRTKYRQDGIAAARKELAKQENAAARADKKAAEAAAVKLGQKRADDFYSTGKAKVYDADSFIDVKSETDGLKAAQTKARKDIAEHEAGNAKLSDEELRKRRELIAHIDKQIRALQTVKSGRAQQGSVAPELRSYVTSSRLTERMANEAEAEAAKSARGAARDQQNAQRKAAADERRKTKQGIDMSARSKSYDYYSSMSATGVGKLDKFNPSTPFDLKRAEAVNRSMSETAQWEKDNKTNAVTNARLSQQEIKQRLLLLRELDHQLAAMRSVHKGTFDNLSGAARRTVAPYVERDPIQGPSLTSAQERARQRNIKRANSFEDQFALPSGSEERRRLARSNRQEGLAAARSRLKAQLGSEEFEAQSAERQAARKARVKQRREMLQIASMSPEELSVSQTLAAAQQNANLKKLGKAAISQTAGARSSDVNSWPALQQLNAAQLAEERLIGTEKMALLRSEVAVLQQQAGTEAKQAQIQAVITSLMEREAAIRAIASPKVMEAQPSREVAARRSRERAAETRARQFEEQFQAEPGSAERTNLARRNRKAGLAAARRELRSQIGDEEYDAREKARASRSAAAVKNRAKSLEKAMERAEIMDGPASGIKAYRQRGIDAAKQYSSVLKAPDGSAIAALNQGEIVVQKDLVAAKIKELRAQIKSTSDAELRSQLTGQLNSLTMKQNALNARAGMLRQGDMDAQRGLRQGAPRSRWGQFTDHIYGKGGQMGSGGRDSLMSFFGGGALTSLRYAVPSMLMFGIGSGIADSIREAEELQFVLSKMEGQVQATFGSRSQEVVTKFKKAIIDTAKDSGLPADQIGESALRVIGTFQSREMGGLQGEDLVEDQIKALGKLQRVTGLTSEQIANDYTAMSLVFGKTFNELGDVTTAVSDATGVSAAEISTFMGAIGVVLKEAGFNERESAALAGSSLQSSGKSASVVSEAYGRVLPEIARKQKELNALAAKTPQLQTVEFVDAVASQDGKAILAEIGRVYASLDKATRSEIDELMGRREAQNILPGLLNQDGYDKALDAANNSSGKFETRYEAVLDNLSVKLARLGENTRVMFKQILEAGLGDALGVVLELGLGIVKVFTSLLSPLAKINEMTDGWLLGMLALGVGAKALVALYSKLAALSVVQGAKGMFGGGAAGKASRASGAASMASMFIPNFATNARGAWRTGALNKVSPDRYPTLGPGGIHGPGFNPNAPIAGGSVSKAYRDAYRRRMDVMDQSYFSRVQDQRWAKRNPSLGSRPGKVGANLRGVGAGAQVWGQNIAGHAAGAAGAGKSLLASLGGGSLALGGFTAAGLALGGAYLFISKSMDSANKVIEEIIAKDRELQAKQLEGKVGTASELEVREGLAAGLMSQAEQAAKDQSNWNKILVSVFNQQSKEDALLAEVIKVLAPEKQREDFDKVTSAGKIGQEAISRYFGTGKGAGEKQTNDLINRIEGEVERERTASAYRKQLQRDLDASSSDEVRTELQKKIDELDAALSSGESFSATYLASDFRQGRIEKTYSFDESKSTDSDKKLIDRIEKNLDVDFMTLDNKTRDAILRAVNSDSSLGALKTLVDDWQKSDDPKMVDLSNKIQAGVAGLAADPQFIQDWNRNNPIGAISNALMELDDRYEYGLITLSEYTEGKVRRAKELRALLESGSAENNPELEKQTLEAEKAANELMGQRATKFRDTQIKSLRRFNGGLPEADLLKIEASMVEKDLMSGTLSGEALTTSLDAWFEAQENIVREAMDGADSVSEASAIAKRGFTVPPAILALQQLDFFAETEGGVERLNKVFQEVFKKSAQAMLTEWLTAQQAGELTWEQIRANYAQIEDVLDQSIAELDANIAKAEAARKDRAAAAAKNIFGNPNYFKDSIAAAAPDQEESDLKGQRDAAAADREAFRRMNEAAGGFQTQVSVQDEQAKKAKEDAKKRVLEAEMDYRRAVANRSAVSLAAIDRLEAERKMQEAQLLTGEEKTAALWEARALAVRADQSMVAAVKAISDAKINYMKAVAESNGDELGALAAEGVRIQSDLQDAMAAGDETGVWAAMAAQVGNEDATRRAQEQFRSAQFSFFKLVAAKDDPVGQAKVDLAQAQEQLSLARGDKAKLEAQQRVIEVERQLDSAMNDVRQSMFSLRQAELEAMGDSVGAAQVAAQAASQQLQEALKRGAGQTELNGLRANLVTSEKAARDALFSDQMDEYQYLLDMGRITKSQYISYLEGLKSTLAPGTRQFKDLEVTLRNLKNDLSGDLQANLPKNLLLPTTYEVRRLAQSGTEAGVSNVRNAGYQDQRVYNTQISIGQNMSEGQIVDILSQALGTNASGSGSRRY